MFALLVLEVVFMLASAAFVALYITLENTASFFDAPLWILPPIEDQPWYQDLPPPAPPRRSLSPSEASAISTVVNEDDFQDIEFDE